MIITIDGPAASGKSTIGRILAQKLGYYYLCSGLLYRALGYLLMYNCSYTIETVADPLPEDIARCFDTSRFFYCYDKQTQKHVFFDNVDITPYLKDKCIDKISSIISANHIVRSAVATLQHCIAFKHDVVVDGRDSGSVVFPYAKFKFFVTAVLDVRAERWRKDQEKYDHYFSHDQAELIITERDNRDKSRTVFSHDAITIDTSDFTIEQSVKKMMEIIEGYVRDEP